MSDHSNPRIFTEDLPSLTVEADVYTRFPDTPSELAWKAWTMPGRFKCWGGPRGYTALMTETDPRVGDRKTASHRAGWVRPLSRTFQDRRRSMLPGVAKDLIHPF